MTFSNFNIQTNFYRLYKYLYISPWLILKTETEDSLV